MSIEGLNCYCLVLHHRSAARCIEGETPMRQLRTWIRISSPCTSYSGAFLISRSPFGYGLQAARFSEPIVVLLFLSKMGEGCYEAAERGATQPSCTLNSNMTSAPRPEEGNALANTTASAEVQNVLISSWSEAQLIKWRYRSVSLVGE